MVDLEAIVKAIAFLLQPHLDIAEARVTYIEATWNSECLDKAAKPATLLIFNLLLDSIGDISPVRLLLFPRLDRELLARAVKPVLMQLTVVISDTIAHLILNGQADDVAWHEGHFNVYIDMELVAVVRGLNGDH